MTEVSPEQIGTHYYNSEFEENRDLFQNILRKLRRKIRTGSYELLVGDDASGRIPTLVLRKVLSALFQEEGHAPPSTIFLSGISGDQGASRQRICRIQSAIAKRVQTNNRVINFAYSSIARFLGGYLQDLRQKRALVVTEYIYSGGHIRPIVKGLHRNHIGTDVAALISEKKRICGTPVIYGVWGRQPGRSLPFYGSGSINGVCKEISSAALYTKPVEDMRSLRLARQDVCSLSEELIEWYRENIR